MHGTQMKEEEGTNATVLEYRTVLNKGTKAQPIGRGVNGKEKRLHTMAQIVWEAASIPGAE